jgi:predicted transcriptional regulator
VSETEWRRRRKKLGVSVNKLAKLVGIQTSAMRNIDIGANKPSVRTKPRLEAVLADLEKNACPCCKRAILEVDDGDDSEGKAAEAQKG